MISDGQSYSFNKPVSGEVYQTKHGIGKGGAPWAKKKSPGGFSKGLCNNLPQGPPVTTYAEGGEMEVIIPTHAEHGGEWEFRLCPKSWSTLRGEKSKLNALIHILFGGDACLVVVVDQTDAKEAHLTATAGTPSSNMVMSALARMEVH